MTVRSLPPDHDLAGILHRQHRRESSARTYARSLPIVPTQADGMEVTGADGRRYLDCLSGAGTLALGHNHPVVTEALRRVLDRGSPLHVLDMASPEKDEFVEALFASLPPDLAENGRVHFCGPAGTDAVEAALKLAHTATGQRGVLSFTGAYHGMTMGALSATGRVAAKQPVPGLAADVTRLPFPHPYRCPFGVGGETSTGLAAEYVERLLSDPTGGIVPPAAMILEPVQGEGGVVPAPAEWLRRMRRITAAHEIPLIVDEVQTGVGRTGTFWGVQHADVAPDVMVCSKAIGGSLPLAVIVYREEFDAWMPGAHAGTFRGNTLAMAAGAATLRFVAAEDLDRRAAEVGERLLSALKDLGQELPTIGDVRGRGLMVGLEMVRPDGPVDPCGARPPAPDLAARVQQECLRRGLIVELGGRSDTVVRLLPPLTITDEQAATVLERLAEAVSAAQEGLAAETTNRRATA
jgi:diaminobutyrate-2-oxoglutarate transaminase